MTVLNFEGDGFSTRAKERWASIGNYVETSVHTFKELPSLSEVEIIIVRLRSYIGKDITGFFPNLKYIITATTGLDHIDLNSAAASGVQVISLKGETDFLNTISSTSEHTWALLLSLVRNIPASCTSVSKGHWDRDMFKGIQLRKKSIGIIGLGRTGKMVAQYARTFDMEVNYFDPFVTDTSFIKHSSLESLLKVSDVVSIHVHLQKDTENLLNKEMISIMKVGSYFINTSRGKLVDEQALVDQLKCGKIKGVATDVLASELTGIKESELYIAMIAGLNIIITPHIGGATWDAMHLCEEFIVNKFISKHQ